MTTHARTISKTLLLAILVVLLSFSTTAVAHAAEQTYDVPDCGIGYGKSLSFYPCILVPVSNFASSMMLSLGGNILTLAGAVFDFGINHTIINFKDTLENKLGMMTTIEGAWTFFRDLANIVIIGIFVFIAISLILGLKEYGQKRLVARVLIIAVLLNFSLLFTKIIIDASNFVAYSIYQQTAAKGTDGRMDVANEILKPLKIGSTFDTAALAEQVYKQDGPNVGKALAFGFFGFLILTLLAIVLFYGAFLVLARAIMLILLMFSAPLAYASYLAPHFEEGIIGWNNWWKSLINNAIFAPLLMVFLSMSILIMKAASTKVTTTATFGDIGSNPVVLKDAWTVLLLYIIGTGLLLVSFRMSSQFAGSISGIRVGQMAAGLPLAFGLRGAAFMGQRSIGRVASNSASNKAALASQARLNSRNTNFSEAARAAFEKQAEKFERQKTRRDTVAGSSFNLMNTSLGKALAGGVGLSGAFAGEKKGNFKMAQDEASKRAQAQAAQTNLNDHDKDHVRAEYEAKAREDASAKEAAARQSFEDAKKEREQIAKDAQVAVEKNKSDRGGELVEAARELASAESGHAKMLERNNSEMANLQQQERAATGDAQSAITKQIIERRAAHASELSAQKQRIEAAHGRITEINKDINLPMQKVTDADTKVTETEAKLKEASDPKKIKASIVAAGKDAVKDLEGRDAELRGERYERIAQQNESSLGRSTVAKITEDLNHKFKKPGMAASLAKALKEERGKDEGGGAQH